MIPMSEANVTLAIISQGWQTYQNCVSEAIAPLSLDQLALPAATNLRSIDELARFTPADLQENIQNEHRGKTYSFTRGWVVWHVIEHDLHHGGEIAYSLGMHGLKAPDI